MTVQEFVRWATQCLEGQGVLTPRLDAELIVTAVLKCQRMDLLINHQKELSLAEEKNLKSLLQRRLAGEPMAYLLGEREFFSYVFTVNNKVLVPRSETEILVEQALQILSDEKKFYRVLDFGCGSGCIGITLLKKRPTAEVIAIDISKEALEVAKENAKKLGVADRIKFLVANIREMNPHQRLFEGIDLIVANPPYVDATDPSLDIKTLRFEPTIALYSDDNGYNDPLSWATKAAQILPPGGSLLMEIGEKQSDRIAREMATHYNKIEVIKDLAGLPRVVWAKK